MPGRKGRKRRHRDRHRERTPEATATLVTARPVQNPAATDGSRIPSRSTRVTGLMIAVITAFLAAMMIVQNTGSDAESIVRIAAGAALIALAIVVGVLSVFPEQVRRIVHRE